MNYMLSGHNLIQDVQPMVQVFFPYEGFSEVSAPSDEGVTVLSAIDGSVCISKVFLDGGEKCESRVDMAGPSDRHKKMAVKKTIYLALSQFLGMSNPWGILTGIRPAKTVAALLENLSEDEVIEELRTDYLCIKEKSMLAIEVAKREKLLVGDKRHIGRASVYIGIPFCPTTCLYCSFTSYPIGKYKDRQGDYLAALFKELEFIADANTREIDTLYIGGGTPTSLGEKDLEALLIKIHKLFPVQNLREFSVEAGRPDTLNPVKLGLLKDFGVGRISINPQTIHDKTLRLIGRAHTAAEFFEGYEMAVNAGFDNINIDTILGLPGETTEDVRQTFSGLAGLGPKSITVHTLAVKRASRLMEDMRVSGENRLTNTREIVDMLDFSRGFTRDAGLLPYYMYRQKNMLGNFENVGYAKPGFECLYNILIMEEIQTIYAAGAGSVTKIVEGGKIERVFNVKNVDEYMSRIDEMIERKRERLGQLEGMKENEL